MQPSLTVSRLQTHLVRSCSSVMLALLSAISSGMVTTHAEDVDLANVACDELRGSLAPVAPCETPAESSAPSPVAVPVQPTSPPTEPTSATVDHVPTVSPTVPTTESVASTDSDGDGLSDQEEAVLGTDPQLVDTDGDGLSDTAEYLGFGTNPLLPDTDGDGLSDGVEVGGGSDPNDPLSPSLEP